MWENERLQEAQARINACKSLLADSDYQIIKIAESMVACETVEDLLAVFKTAAAENGKTISDRKKWRDEIGIAEAEIGSGFDTGIIDDYVVGKTYYRGDKVYFGGKTYECIAPDGAICVWSPSDYPTYWRRLA